MNDYYQIKTIFVVDELKYELVKYYDDDIRAEIIGCNNDDAVIKIPDNVIYNDVEYPVTRIKEEVFERRSLKTIIVSGNVTLIEKNCFRHCSQLEEVVLPDGLNYLGENCFYGCKALKSINIPAKIDTMESNCFYGCESLTKVVIPTKSCYIGNDCFGSCHSLQTVILSEGMIKMGSSCFSWCEKLETIKLPSTLTCIPSSAFCGCKALKSINIPENVKTLDSECFRGCDALTEVKIPINVEIIDNYAFHGCKSLHRITIMNRDTKLMFDCFSDCPSLVEIVFPNKEMEINDICVDLCPLLSEETRSHIKITEEGEKRKEDRTVKSKIKRAFKKAWENSKIAALFLIAAPIFLIGFLIFSFISRLIIEIGAIALMCFVVGLICMLLLSSFVKIEHKFDWKYNCACIIIGAIILGLIYLRSK